MTDLRKLAKGMECQIRLPGICRANPETTVLAHYRGIGISGAGLKAPDLLGSWACYQCHMACDGHTKTPYPETVLELYFLQGVMRTQAILVSEEIVKW